MADFKLPTLADMLQAQPGAAPDNTEALAAEGRQILANRAAPAQPQRNFLTAGLSAGIDELQGFGGAAVSAVGKAIGAEGLANWGAEVSRRNSEEAAANGRPDLETAPWKEGGASVLPWLGYQAAKQIPQLAAYFAGGALMPEAAVPAGLARLGMAVPGILGGGRGVAAKVAQEAVAAGAPEAVAGFAGKRAGLEAGKDYAKEFLGAAAVGAPLGAGSMYQEALDRGGATQGEALAALGLSPVYGALEAVQPAQLERILSKGMTGGLGKRLLTGAAVGAAGEIPTESAQTALEQAFRPDVPLADKAQAVIDAALTGAAVGGIFGGAAGGIGKAKAATPTTPQTPAITTTTPTDTIGQAVDQVLQLTYQPKQGAPMFVAPGGAPAQSLYEAQQAQQVSTELSAQQQAAQAQQEAAAAQQAAQQQAVQGGMAQLEAQPRALPAPPPAPASLQERFAQYDNAALTSMLTKAQERIAAKEVNPQLEQSTRLIRAELDRREGVRPEPTPATGGLFAEADYTGVQQPMLMGDITQRGRPIPTPTAPAREMRNLAEQIYGTSNQFTKQLKAENPTELVVAVLNGLDRGLQTATTIAKRLGIDKNFATEIPKAQQSLVDVRLQAQANKATPEQVQQAEAALARLEQAKALRDAAEQVRSGGPSPAASVTQAPSAEVSPPASQTGLTSLIQEPQTPTTIGEQGTLGLEVAPKAELQSQIEAIANNKKVPGRLRQPAVAALRAIKSGSPDAQPLADQALRTIAPFRGQYGLFATPTAQPQAEVAPQAAPQISAEQLLSTAGVEAPTTQAEKDYVRARAIVEKNTGTTAKQLQSALKVGYNNAASILERLQNEGVAPRAETAPVTPAPAPTATPTQEGPTQRLYLLNETPLSNGTTLQTYTTSESRARNNKSTQFVDVTSSELMNMTGGTTQRADEFNSVNPDIAARAQTLPQQKAKGTKAERTKAEKAAKAEEKPKPAAEPTAAGGGAQPPGQPPKNAAPAVPSQGPGPAPQGDFISRVIDRFLASLNNFISPDLKGSSLKNALFWYGLPGIVRTFDRFFDGKLSQYMAAIESKRTFRNAWVKRSLAAFDRAGQLMRNNEAAFSQLMKLMASTSSNLRPGKDWAEHTWLHNDPNAAALKAELESVNQIYRKLKKDGWADPKTKTVNAIDIYEDMLANNEGDAYATQATINYLKYVSDPIVNTKPGFAANPMVEYLKNISLHESPKATRDYWKSVIAAQTATTSAAAKSDKARVDLRNTATANTTLEDTLGKGAYFHLGREGDYMVSFDFKLKGDAPDPAAVDAFRAALDKVKLDQFEISKAPGKGKVFLRLETEGQREQVQRILKDFTAQGLVEGNFKLGSRGADAGNSGGIESLRDAADLAREIRNNMEAQIQKTTDPDQVIALKSQLDATEAVLRKAALNLLPDNSLAKVLARRQNVSGFSADMLRNAAYRNEVTASALANMSFYPETMKAYSDISLLTREAGQAQKGQIDTDLLRKREAVRDELGKRLNEDEVDTSRSILDYLRPVGYIYYLTSPASATLQLASIPTFVWPKLGAKYGFVKSAKAFGKTAKTAIKIVNAAVKHGMEAGFFRALDIFFDEKALKAAGIDADLAQYILQVANTTAIEFGSMSRELGRLSSSKKGSGLDRALAMAGFMNNYTETLSRIWTALAVRELAPKDADVVATAKDVIDSTIFDFSKDKEPRAYGSQGVLKQYSPVALQFTKINAFMTGEIYRNAKDAFTSAAQTEEQKREARRFLAGHMTAVAALSGTLGLPFASAIATAINQIAGAFGDDDEPYDVQTAWRNWLAGAFGKDMGEIIARGLPRAAGFDISERVGEAGLVPFSKFLADRRKFEDKFQDFVTGLAGAPIGAVSSMGLGISQIANGDVLKGMQQMMPAGIRAPIQAYVMGSKGYVDKTGNVIPMDVGAADILYQAIGFKPAEKAEYDEARMGQLSRESVLSRKSGDLRRKLATAVEDGDIETQRKLLGQAKDFDAGNPAYAVLPSLESTIKQRAKARALASTLGVTFGTNIKDLGSIASQQYANINR